MEMEPPNRLVLSPEPGALELTEGNVESALHQLYYDPDMDHKNVAQKWLTQAQTSTQAWQFCWPLLGPDKLPEIQFFGASTLHTKISRHWADLPIDQHQTLRMQLLSHISHFSKGPKMVLTRLCVALASLALHTIPQAWPRAVSDMVLVFQPEKTGSGNQSGAGDVGGAGEMELNNHSHCLALLELLTVLPEELQSCRLPQGRRAQLREALAGEWTVVCPLLRQLLQKQEAPSQVKERCLRCLSSWVGLDIPLHGESEGLLQDCFAALSDPELFNTAVETIVCAISQPDCQRYTDALVNLMPLVLGLHDQLKAAARDGDMETSHGICRIAVALGETHSRTLLEQVQHWQGYLSLVNMILFCTSIPGHYPVSETTSSLTLTFWYTLQDDILSFEEDRRTVYLQVYRPVYLQLVDILLEKSHFPSEQDYISWSSDDKELFRIYRVDISDTLMYVYEILGAELLSNLYDRLGQLLMATEGPAAWQDIEALLFGFQSIAETIDVNYSDVIPGLIGLIPRISISNIQLADTVMYTIGSLAEWLADHPLMLGCVVPMVLQGLVKAELSVSSVSTLKRICRECRHDLAPYAPDIMTVSQDVLAKEIHKSSQCMWLMQGLGFLLSALPVEEILGRLTLLITPHIQTLDTLAHQEPSPTTKLSIIHILEKDHLGPIKHLIELVTSTTQSIFQQGPSEHPDIVESFMQLHAEALKREPGLYRSEHLDVKSLFYCGILALKFPETPTAKSACLFFAELVCHCVDIPPIGQVLHRDGKLLIQTILEAVGGQSPHCLTEHFSQVLFCLNRHCHTLLSQWLKEGLHVPGFPTAQISMEQKDTFNQQLLREQSNKRHVVEIVNEFSLLCRGLQGPTGHSADY
uniref:Importin-13 n=1 Tax=Esox lucius TaxID=8010 RepID=A0A3P8ZFH5_ESOLU